jgi:hypothetical protein
MSVVARSAFDANLSMPDRRPSSEIRLRKGRQGSRACLPVAAHPRLPGRCSRFAQTLRNISSRNPDERVGGNADPGGVVDGSVNLASRPATQRTTPQGVPAPAPSALKLFPATPLQPAKPPPEPGTQAGFRLKNCPHQPVPAQRDSCVIPAGFLPQYPSVPAHYCGRTPDRQNPRNTLPFPNTSATLCPVTAPATEKTPRSTSPSKPSRNAKQAVPKPH